MSFGGVDAADYAPESVLRNVALVDQDVFLFDDSVMDNVRYARPGASDEEVREACRLANADEFVRALPQGYNTRIGENGGQLSGGERQRISIARAILRDAPIVLLDEATSNLDVENELAVREAVANLLSRRKTVVMVAHTLPIIRTADRSRSSTAGRSPSWARTRSCSRSAASTPACGRHRATGSDVIGYHRSSSKRTRSIWSVDRNQSSSMPQITV